MSTRAPTREATVRAVLLDRDAAYARLDDLADQLAAVELENRELRAQLAELTKRHTGVSA